MTSTVQAAGESARQVPPDGAYVTFPSHEVPGCVATGWWVLTAAGRALAADKPLNQVWAAVMTADGKCEYLRVCAEFVTRSDLEAPGEAGAVLSVGAPSNRELHLIQQGLERHQAMDQLRALNDEKWRTLECDAHEWADEHSLCEQFDQFMVEHGMQARVREYTVTVDTTIQLRHAIAVEASSPDMAKEDLDMEAVLNGLPEELDPRSAEFDLMSWTIVGVE